MLIFLKVQVVEIQRYFFIYDKLSLILKRNILCIFNILECVFISENFNKSIYFTRINNIKENIAFF